MKNDDIGYHRQMVDGLMDLHELIDYLLISRDLSDLPNARKKLHEIKSQTSELAKLSLKEYLAIGE